MNLSKNEIKIIKMLITSKQYISSYDIAIATGIKRSLVRNEMLNVKNIIQQLGYTLTSKNSKGYLLENIPFEDIYDLEVMLEQAECQRENFYPSMQGERQIYIFNKLIDSDDYIKIDDLAEALLTSRSTITNDLKDARRRMDKYHLILKQRPNYGIYIDGEELSKRRLQCDLLFTNLSRSNMLYDYLDTFIHTPDTMENALFQSLISSHLHLSDIAICDFLFNLSISLKRISTNHCLQSSSDFPYLMEKEEYIIAHDIANILETFGYIINEHEIQRMAIQLLCKQEVSYQSIYDDELKTICNEVTTAIYQQTLIHMDDDTTVQQLCAYLQTSMLRIKYDEKIRTPLYNELKSVYPLGYEIAMITSSIIEKHFKSPLSLSELTMYSNFYHNLIQNKKVAKKKVIFLDGLGRESREACCQNILDHFANHIEITVINQYHELFQMELQPYDFIISTMPIRTSLCIPHINISQVISNDDLVKIDNHVSYLYNSVSMETLFHPQLFNNHVKITTKAELATVFYEILIKQFKMIKSTFKNNLANKQHTKFTYFDQGIGLLQAIKPLHTTDIITVVLLEEPLIWEKKELHIVFLFSCIDDNNYIFNTLSTILSNFACQGYDIQTTAKLTYVEFLKLLKECQ